MIYFDHAATTLLLPEAKKAMVEAMELVGNPASPHRLGRKLSEQLKNYHDYFEGLAAGKFIFTSSATESNNTILKGTYGNPKIWLAQGDHPSLSRFITYYKEQGREVGIIPFLENGKIDLEALINLLGGEDLIAFSLVDGQTGVQVLDHEEVNQLKTRFPGTHLHLDASQAFGKIKTSLNEFSYDTMTICSHKIGGPVGIAGLYYKNYKNDNFTPLLIGGGHEEGLRSSTPSLFLMAGFMAAAKEFLLTDKNFILEQKKRIKDLLETYLPVSFPFCENAHAYILSFFVEHSRLTSDLFLRFFEEREIYLSSTAACSSKKNLKRDNPALLQLGYKKNRSQQFLRLSLSIHPSFDSIQYNQFETALREIKAELGPLLS